MSARNEPLPRGFNDRGIDLTREKAKVESVSLDLGNGSHIELLPIEFLDPFPKNREIDDTDLDIFSENISRNGFQSTIVVAKREKFDKDKNNVSGRYYIISGHRRVEAVRMILKENSDFMGRKIPALILREDIPFEQLEELNILMNYDAKAERPKEMRARVARLLELLKERNVSRQLNQKIADKLNVSARQIRKYVSINNNLSLGLLRKLDDEYITVTQANNFASRSVEAQEEILKILDKNNNKISDEEYNLIKEKDEEKKKAISEYKSKQDEYENEVEAQKKEIASLREKIKELEIRLDVEKGRQKEEVRSELERTKNELYEVEKKKEKYFNIIRQAKESQESSEQKESVSLSTSIVISKMLNTLSSNISKIQLKISNQNYEISRNDADKIKTMINDLQEIIRTKPSSSSKSHTDAKV